MHRLKRVKVLEKLYWRVFKCLLYTFEVEKKFIQINKLNNLNHHLTNMLACVHNGMGCLDLIKLKGLINHR